MRTDILLILEEHNIHPIAASRDMFDTLLGTTDYAEECYPKIKDNRKLAGTAGGAVKRRLDELGVPMQMFADKHYGVEAEIRNRLPREEVVAICKDIVTNKYWRIQEAMDD